MEYPEKRELDGVYTRQVRDGRWYSVCISDLNAVELNKLISKKDPEWNRQLCDVLLDDISGIVRSTEDQPNERIEAETCAFIVAKALRSIGDQLDIKKVHPEDEQIGE